MGVKSSKLSPQGQINHNYWSAILSGDPPKLLNYLIEMRHQPNTHAQHVWDLPLLFQFVIYCTRFTKDNLIKTCQHYEDYFQSQIHSELETDLRLNFMANEQGDPVCGEIKSNSKDGKGKGVLYSLHGCTPLRLLRVMKNNLQLFHKSSQRSLNLMSDIYDYMETYLSQLEHQVPKPIDRD